MTKSRKTSGSASKHAKQIVKATRNGSRSDAMTAASVAQPVTPTSERIIKETSEKRRKAMMVLANR